MSRSGWIGGLAVLLIALGTAATWLRCEGTPPEFTVSEEIRVGREPVEATLTAADADSGLRDIRIVLVHADGEVSLLLRRFPGDPLRGGNRNPTSLNFSIDAATHGLGDGNAVVEARARDWSWRNWLRGNETLLRVPVLIDRHAPRVSIQSNLTYVQRAGTAAVIYQVNEATRRDGVQVADTFFPSFPWPPAEAGAAKPVSTPPGDGAAETPSDASTAESPAEAPSNSGTSEPATLPSDLRAAGGRIALFAVPHDAPENSRIEVIAEDRVGNRGRASWPTRLQERQFQEERIQISEAFLGNVVPPLAEENNIQAADPVATFQEINQKLRRANEARVRELTAHSSAIPLWEGAFVQWPNSKVTSHFAEHRTYWFQDQQISEATHFGYDLAATTAAPVTATSRGRVLFAGPLGIYGNCVLIDHGLGVASLYGHLSRMDVAEGDMVNQGATLGLSGQTGLAGGDHLHFAILVSGVYVDPVEWWDPKWMREHIGARLAPETP